MNWLEITAIVLIVANTLGVVLFFSLREAFRYYRRNYMLIFQTDRMATEQHLKLVGTLYNVDKFSVLFGSHEKNLRFYYGENKIEGVTFEKHPSIRNALRVTWSAEDAFKTEMTKSYGRSSFPYKVSPDKGETLISVITLSDKEIKKKKKVYANKSHEEAKLKKSLFLDYKNSDKHFHFDYAKLVDIKKGTHMHINERKSTSTSLRFQMIIPDEYAKKVGLEPESVKLYYVFDGYLYEMETVFLRKVNEFYQWDVINLQPNTAYVGLSISSSHNPIIRPNKAFYGTTKDEEGHVDGIDSSQIAAPDASYIKHKMWDEKIAIEALGEDLAKLQYDIIAKKHHEFHNSNAFVPIKKAETVYKEFPWLKTGK